jgi:hypothetical protein
VTIYDISVPYEDNWTFFQMLRKLPEAQNRAFIVTTVNKRVLDRRIGPTDTIEIPGGRADDLAEGHEAVEKVVGPPASTLSRIRPA